MIHRIIRPMLTTIKIKRLYEVGYNIDFLMGMFKSTGGTMAPKIIGFAAVLVVTMLMCLNNVCAQDKILWIDSYNKGYTWTAELGKAISETIQGHDIEYKIFHMDTKRKNSQDDIRNAAQHAVSLIKSFQPDVVIASDDDASKYVVVPYFKDASTPFVFCGVNHTVERYGYPFRNVTGIIEMDPVDRLIFSLSRFHAVKKVGYLTEDGTTGRINGEFYKTQTRFECVNYYVKTFDEWKTAFLRAQVEVDILILGPNSRIEFWDDNKALDFVMANTKIPTGCLQDRMTKFSFIGCLKLPEEQGEWAANTALKILNGVSISSIPIARPQKHKFIINLNIAKANGIKVPMSYINKADVIIK